MGHGEVKRKAMRGRSAMWCREVKRDDNKVQMGRREWGGMQCGGVLRRDCGRRAT